MFHYPATRRINDFGYSLSPRDKYLAAIAEAEADYLAAEAIQQEEVALRRRLQEVQLQKKRIGGYHTPSYGSPYFDDNIYGHQSLHSYERPTLRRQAEEYLLRQIEEEERVRQAEERLRLHSLIATKQAEREREARYTPERLGFAFNHRAEVEHDFLRQQPTHCGCQRASHPQVHTTGSPKLCQSLGQCQCAQQQVEVGLHPFFQPVIGRKDTRALPSHRQEKSELVNLGQLFDTIIEADKPRAATDAHQATRSPEVLQSLINGYQLRHNQNTPRSAAPKPTAHVHRPEADILKSIVEVFSGERQQATESTKQQSALKASSEIRPAANPHPKVEDFLPIINLIFGRNQTQEEPKKDKQQPKVSAAPEASKPASIESSLKEQLESRLNNEYATEVRDTIHAILASLHDSNPHPAVSAPHASSSAGSSKGKAPESPTTAVPISTEANSQDVVKSINDVRSIEATFDLLESEFTFPSQLDFTPPSDSTSNTTAPAISHLTFTSRNNPVRHYEQTLGALLAQLDSVDSFGNDTLRAMRKEVVARIEKALEELESEVEGRWRAKIAKSTRVEVTSPVVASSAAPAQSSESRLGADALQVSAPAPVSETPQVADLLSEISAINDSISVDHKTAVSNQPAEDSLPSSNETGVNNSVLSAPSLDASAATIRPYDASPVDVVDVVDTFLLPDPSNVESTKSKDLSVQKHDNGDTGSDWSEVEA